MKIQPINIPQKPLLKAAGIMSVVMLSVLPMQNIQAQNKVKDEFVRAETLIPPGGIHSDMGTFEFPTPQINVGGEFVNAAVVVDLKTNVLYLYDTVDGYPIKAYKVASGKKWTPTRPCIKQIVDFEEYPYKKAPGSKRSRNPKAYGPKLVRMKIVDSKTGNIIGENGEYIHGNNDASSIGKYISHGCIRMDNHAIKELVSQLSIGDYVVFKKD